MRWSGLFITWWLFSRHTPRCMELPMHWRSKCVTTRVAGGYESLYGCGKNLSMSDPTRPGPITLYSDLYIWNRRSDWQAVFLCTYLLPCTGPVVTHAGSAARGAWGCHKWFTGCNSVTAEPLPCYLMYDVPMLSGRKVFLCLLIKPWAIKLFTKVTENNLEAR